MDDFIWVRLYRLAYIIALVLELLLKISEHFIPTRDGSSVLFSAQVRPGYLNVSSENLAINCHLFLDMKRPWAPDHLAGFEPQIT